MTPALEEFGPCCVTRLLDCISSILSRWLRSSKNGWTGLPTFSGRCASVLRGVSAAWLALCEGVSSMTVYRASRFLTVWADGLLGKFLFFC